MRYGWAQGLGRRQQEGGSGEDGESREKNERAFAYKLTRNLLSPVKGTRKGYKKISQAHLFQSPRISPLPSIFISYSSGNHR